MWTPVNMQSGFNLSNNSVTSEHPEFIDRVKAIMMTFMGKAITMGGKYASSAGRDTLTATDLLYALQYQAHTFLDEVDETENIETEFDQHITSNNENSGPDSESEEEEDDEESDNEDEPPFTRCENSDDEQIIKMNEYHDQWESWLSLIHI